MGKTRNTGKLATQIQFDNSNNLVIGNSTSSSFNTSGSVNAIGGITGSIFGIGDPTSFSSSISSDLVNLESKSASVDISISNINSFTASNGNTSLNAATSSYSKLTGGNTFTGTQIVSASVYIQGDLVVQGSSSIQYISASSVSIGTNVVQLNTATPAVRYAGLTVQDSGSAQGVTGSMLWDSCCNRWIYSNPSGVGYSGGVLMSGPRAATLGSETTLTCNYIAKSGGGDHLYDSCIIDDGTTVCINAKLEVNSTDLNNIFVTNPSTTGTTTGSGIGFKAYNGTSIAQSAGIILTSNAWSYGTYSANQLSIGADGPGGIALRTACSAPISFFTGCTTAGLSAERMRITSGGCVGIGATSPCSLLNVHCVSGGGDSLYTNMFTITTDASSVYNHLAFSPTSIEYRRETGTGVDLCIRTLVCNGSSGGNIVFAPNLDATSYCSYPRMKIQQNGFIGIGAFCAQTYLHVCDNLSAGRDDLIRLQTTISTNHAWLKSISCAGVTSIFGSNRANTDGTLIANHAVAGTTSGHNFDLISNNTVRIRLSSSGAVYLLGNSSDYPSLFLAGPNYTMVAMGDRSSSSCTDVGFISVFNQGCKVIDLPGNVDPITFNNGGPMIAGRAYVNGDATFGYQFLEICNGNTYHGPLSMGNSGGGLALTPFYCGGGKRYGLGWNSGELNNIANYNNCTPIVIHWGINGDNATTDRKFCFNYSGNAYSTGGTWGTLSSNCIIKDCITAANSQWNDIKNICIVNYKMKDEITEFGNAARIHLGVIAEQIAEVSPGLLEDGGYNEKWCACLNGVKTSILHMKAVKALQEAMCRIELLEACLGIS